MQRKPYTFFGDYSDNISWAKVQGMIVIDKYTTISNKPSREPCRVTNVELNRILPD